MRTRTDGLSLQTLASFGVRHGLRYRLAVRLGRRFARWEKFAAEHDEARTRVDEPRMRPEEVASLSAGYASAVREQASQHVERLRREYDHLVAALDDPSDENRMIVATRACRRELAADPSLRSAVNIGCGFDLTFFYLAQRYPELSFTSVDFTDEPRKVLGQAFPEADALANWKTVPGYALDLLERGELAGDLVLLSGVVSMLTNLEWRAYLKKLAEVAQRLVIVDVWYPPPRGLPLRVLRPEEIDPRESLVMAGFEGGRYMHNHIEILRDYGFEATTSRLGADRCYVLELIARRRRSQPA